MKYQSIAILIFFASVAAAVLAQNGGDESRAPGMLHYIPQFTGTNKLGDSNLFQAGRKLGVNTTTPQATLDVRHHSPALAFLA
jgi:hypothetical protein